MPYFIFKEACATRETGSVYPQIQKWKPSYDDDKSDSYYSYYNASKDGFFPDFPPDMDALVMHGKAKPTDIVSSGLSIGFIISAKLKSLFEKFFFPPHCFYPAKVLYKKTELDSYYFMHVISDYTDFVDYSKSTFVTSGFSGDDSKPIVLRSKEDYIKESKRLQNDSFVKKLPYRSIKADVVYFNEKFNKGLDFFEIGRFDGNVYISQSLRNALIENNISGCDITLTNRINF